MKNLKEILVLLSVTILFISSCKDTILYGPDPYSGGKEPFPIRFYKDLPIPNQGIAGTAMRFKVYGADKFKEKIQFLISGMPAVITELTDTSLTAILPENVSTGQSTIVIDGQIFLGPVCRVRGKLGLDPTFNPGNASNGPINCIKQLKNGQVFIGGYFTNYDGFSASTPVNSIARITPNGAFVKEMSFGAGAIGGSVNNIHELQNGDLLLSGNILNYDSIKMVSNFVRVNAKGTLLTKKVDILNLTDDPAKSTLTVPVFNGGTLTAVKKSFVLNDKVSAIGSFDSYVDRYYPRSTFDNILMGFFDVGSVVRMHLDGRLDSTFNIDRKALPPAAYNGFGGLVYDGYLQADGQLLAVGFFNRYNNQNVVGNILRLDDKGAVDASFQVGQGADGTILSIVPNAAKDKYYLAGSFSTYNKLFHPRLVRVALDGSHDPSFQSLGFTGGGPSFVRELQNGLIVVAGNFKKYGDVVREGLCILNLDGSLAKDYNNTGKLDGQIFDALEGRNSLGQRTVTLVGDFRSFDGNNTLNNIMRLVVQD